MRPKGGESSAGQAVLEDGSDKLTGDAFCSLVVVLLVASSPLSLITRHSP